MPKHGVIHVPNAVTERVARVIASFEHGEFTIPQVLAHAPDLPRDSVRSAIRHKKNVGWLERVGRGRYRIGGIRMRTILPLGLVSEAVWMVLSTDPAHRFMRRAEIAGEAESVINRPGVSAYRAVSNILGSWYQCGHLERTGPRGEYAYRLREGITERPLVKR